MIPGIVAGGSQAGGGGGFPVFIANGSLGSNGGSTTTPTNIQYPAGLQAVDIAFLQVMSVENSTTAHVVDTPSGWNLAGESAVNSLARNRHALFWKRLDGTESGNVGIGRTPGYGATDQLCGVISIFRGCVATGTPYEGLDTATGANSGTNLTGPAVDTTGANRLAVDFVGLTGNRTLTAPSGRDERYDLNVTNGTAGATVFAGTREQASAGTVGADTYTASTGSWNFHVYGLALIPA